jgi:hypothetical protein
MRHLDRRQIAGFEPSTEALNDQILVRAMWWWILAVFPILLAVLPVKDFRWNSHTWYRFLVWVKFVLLWVAVVFSGIGAIHFLRAVS